MNNQIYKKTVEERFSKAVTTYTNEAIAQRKIAEKMTELVVRYITKPCSEIIEFGCGTGIYSRMLLQHLHPEHLWINDLCNEMKQCFSDIPSRQFTFLPGDAEFVAFPANKSLITSCSALQWFESPGLFFQKCHELLNQQGYLAFSTFGKENMKEIRELTGAGLTYYSKKELEKLLSPYFQIIHAEEESIPIIFKHPLEILYHLKQTGVNGVSNNSSDTQKYSFRTRRDIQNFSEQYIERFGKGADVSLTYHPIYIIAKKKTT